MSYYFISKQNTSYWSKYCSVFFFLPVLLSFCIFKCQFAYAKCLDNVGPMCAFYRAIAAS